MEAESAHEPVDPALDRADLVSPSSAHEVVERMWREQGPKLFRSLTAFTGDPDLASDAMAETFAQALGRGSDLRHTDRWIWRSAFLIARGELQQRRRETLELDDAASQPMPEPVADIVAAMRRLSPNQRMAADPDALRRPARPRRRARDRLLADDGAGPPDERAPTSPLSLEDPMTDLRDRLRDLDGLDVPDVFDRAQRIGPKTPMDIEPGPGPARRAAIAAFALIFADVTIAYATRAFDRQIRPAPATPTSPPSTTCAWTKTTLAVPFLGTHRSATRLVAGTSRDDLWVMGSKRPWIDQVLVHYDGERWTKVTLPQDLVNAYSGAMEAPAPNDLWLLTTNGVARFDGSTWTRTTFPGLGDLDSTTSELLDLEVVSPDDAWVTGNVYDAATETWGAVIYHWNGVAWNESYGGSAGAGAASRLVAISAWAPDDVWAAGVTSEQRRGRAVALHWDGTTWTARVVHGRRPASITEFGLVAVGPDDALMTVKAGVLHWDGGPWTDSGFQAPSAIDVPLSMGRGAAGDVWAKVWNTSVARWDGESWELRGLDSPLLHAFYSYGLATVEGSAVFAGTKHDQGAIRIYGC